MSSRKTASRSSMSSNSAWVVGVNAFVALVQLLTVRLTYRWLGESGYAIYVVVIAIMGYVLQFMPSVAYGALNMLVGKLEDGDIPGIIRLHRSQALLIGFTSFIGSAMLLGMGCWYTIPGAHISRAETFTLFAITDVIFLENQINQMIYPVLQALGRFRNLAFRTALDKIASATVSVLLAYRYHSPLGVVTGLAVGSLVGLAINLITLKRSGHPFHILPGRHRDEQSELTRYAMKGYAHRVLIGCSNSADRVLYAYSGRPIQEISRYAVAYRVPEMIQAIFVYAVDPLVLRFLHELRNSQVKACELIDRTSRTLLAVGMCFVAVPCAFGRPLLKLWLGQVPFQTPLAMMLLAFYFALQIYMTAMSKPFYAVDKLDKAAVFTGANALLTVTLTIPAARMGGIVGVAAMNAVIAGSLFIPYAFWTKRCCLPDFGLGPHIKGIVQIVLVGSIYALLGYELSNSTFFVYHSVIAIGVSIVWSYLAMWTIVRLGLAEIPESYRSYADKFLRRFRRVGDRPQI